MRFEILGPLEVADESGRKLGLGGRKQRSVLAILLLHANEVVSQDRLVEELWPGAPPASGATSLQAYVSRLRRVLGEDGRIVRTAGGYLIRVADGDLDVDRFERLVEEGGAAVVIEDWKLASTKLREALGLWRGPPLSDFAYDSFAQAEIARLEELHLAAVERRVEAELALGREAAVIGDLERLVREHPYREQLRSQLMLALYRTGRQAEALDAYREARSVLVEELGIEPSPGLRELHEAILTQDPSLLRAGASVGLTRPDRMRGGEAAAFRRPEEDPAAWEDNDEASPAAWAGETESRHRGRKVGSRAVMVESQHSRLPEGTVTLLFTDIEGSTRLLHEVGELYASVLAEHDRLLRRIWAEHGGVVVDTEGDAFFVAFPEASEAVSAAAAAQAALDSHEWQHGRELRVRMGVHTGVPRLRGNDYWGADVHYAARLCAAAHGRQVLLSASTRELVPDVPVDDLGAHGLKDFAAPRPVYHLRLGGTGADQFPPPKTLSRLRTNLPSLPNRLIGRERELAEMGAM
ncbi:MAG TPA: BTAD domain-containing putative transcriptional regulator, partial [Solirubrobacteraceae bacterium]